MSYILKPTPPVASGKFFPEFMSLGELVLTFSGEALGRECPSPCLRKHNRDHSVSKNVGETTLDNKRADPITPVTIVVEWMKER